MSGRRFTSPAGDLKVEISHAVAADVFRLATAAHPRETGGVLLGRISPDQMSATITTATPAPRDSHSTRRSFIRGTWGLQKLLNDRWLVGEVYLGEWHYHPDAAPTASKPDLQQMLSIVKDAKWHAPEALLLVCGGNKRQGLELALYFVAQDGPAFEMVEVRSSTLKVASD